MVLIAQDGVQRPPIRFPTTGSLMRFLECLETGLVPYGRLDPPLANEKGGGTFFDNHEGKIVKQSLTRDYVFRLVPSVSPEDIGRSFLSYSNCRLQFLDTHNTVTKCEQPIEHQIRSLS